MADTALLVSDSRIKLLGPWYSVSEATAAGLTGSYIPTAGSLRTGWQTSSIHLKFTGTTLSVTLAKKVNDTPDAYLSQIYWFVDGGVPQIYPAQRTPRQTVADVDEMAAFSTPTTFTLPSALASGTHEVTICFMEGSSFGVPLGSAYSDVTSVSTDGTFLQWVQTKPYVGFSGDSISSMEMSIPRFVSNVTPVVAALGGMAAGGRMTGARGALLAIPKMGEFWPYKVVPNYTPGSVGANAIPWAHTQCAAWFIFLGTNDYALGVTTTDFKTAISSHITQIRAEQGNIPIVIMRGIGSTYGQYGTVESQLATELTGVHYMDSASMWSSLTYTTWGSPHWDATNSLSTVGPAVAAVIDTLNLPPVGATATSASDHVLLSWSDTITGEDSWRVERRTI